METQTTTGADSAAAQKPDAAGSDNVTGAERVKRFIEASKARRNAEAKPAKEENPPANESDGADANSPDGAQPEAATDHQSQETQADAETAPDSDEAVLSQFHPKAKEAIQKRIGSYAARAKAAEEKVKSLEAKAAEADTLRQQYAQLQQEQANRKPDETRRAVQHNVDPSDPTLAINDEAGLASLRDDAQETLMLYDRHRRLIDRAIDDGSTTVKIKINGKEGEYPIEDVEAWRDLAIKVTTKSIPARARFLKEKQEHDEKAKAILPEAFDRNRPEYQSYQGVMRANPEIAASPRAAVLVALMVRGHKAMQSDWEAAQAASAKKKPDEKPPDLGESSAASGKVSQRTSGGMVTLDREIREAEKRYEGSGSMADRTTLERLRTRRKGAK